MSFNQSSPPDQVDPFAMFGLSEDNDDIFDGWDPLNDTFPAPDPPVAHRRTGSTGIRRVTSQPHSPYSVPVSQLPVAQSTWEFNGASPMAAIRRPSYTRVLPGRELMQDDAEFLAARCDPTLRFNPRQIGFIPVTLWGDQEVTFGEVVSEFFQRKNNANSRFSHKLFNALRLSEWKPVYRPLVGVFWLNQNILRVDKRAFARLLGIKSIDGSLFHQQGNFPSHGFFEIGAGDAAKWVPPGLDMTGVDFENVRLLIHTENMFKRGCTETDIEHCRWANAKGGK